MTHEVSVFFFSFRLSAEWLRGRMLDFGGPDLQIALAQYSDTNFDLFDPALLPHVRLLSALSLFLRQCAV